MSTSLDHPRQGKTQLFRRNVDLTLLREIFLNPRIHTDLGYQTKGVSMSRSSEVMNDDVDGEEDAAKHQMAKLLAERKAIDEEMKEVQAILDEHERVRKEKSQREREEKERQRKAEEAVRKAAEAAQEQQRRAAEAAHKEALRTARGRNGYWRGLRESVSFKSNFRNDTTCVAIEGDRHLCLYENGDWAYSSGLISNLHKKLHTRARSHPSPEYIAMGSQKIDITFILPMGRVNG